MNRNHKILVIIPARGGSKGLPRKNIRQLNGKPLICYAIDGAMKSKFIDRIIVTTDDSEIAEISKKAGAEVIMRPPSLAQDESPVIDAIFHVLDNINEVKPDFIVLLQPTSPLREASDIDSAIQLFLDGRYDSLISVCPAEHSPYWYFNIKNDLLVPLFDERFLELRRQELPPAYRPNGAIYIITPEILKKYKSFYCNKTLAFVMTVRSSIDIDEEIDFQIAEQLMKQR
ncbi:MAG TPA: acylneuraminate cytidylyltransferase family protein [Candidatus Limnocylindrales bacterium]|nr:acylneuraminate cytidylyltransferase family protein [Candidatus Limnocylindrales bacterium]